MAVHMKNLEAANDTSIWECATKWLLTGKVGLSSTTLLCNRIDIKQPINFPYDNSDFTRCLRLSQYIPEVPEDEYKNKLGEVSPVWKQIFDHWNALCLSREVCNQMLLEFRQSQFGTQVLMLLISIP
ncbi:hypothetical protein FACS18942_01850 [Planctomycetales bacterium]|nr:hypothetical protein FACS18942_01850 [Planctomycetales bacterium]